MLQLETLEARAAIARAEDVGDRLAVAGQRDIGVDDDAVPAKRLTDWGVDLELGATDGTGVHGNEGCLHGDRGTVVGAGAAHDQATAGKQGGGLGGDGDAVALDRHDHGALGQGQEVGFCEDRGLADLVGEDVVEVLASERQARHLGRNGELCAGDLGGAGHAVGLDISAAGEALVRSVEPALGEHGEAAPHGVVRDVGGDLGLQAVEVDGGAGGCRFRLADQELRPFALRLAAAEQGGIVDAKTAVHAAPDGRVVAEHARALAQGVDEGLIGRRGEGGGGAETARPGDAGAVPRGIGLDGGEEAEVPAVGGGVVEKFLPDQE
jgi:hypothetical protein